MTIVFFIALYYVPEDSNNQYLLDKQLAHYFIDWEMHYGSFTNGLRTIQGCLDMLSWYISLETKYETKLAGFLGLRYRNVYIGDYANHVSDHRFEPFFELKHNARFLLSITTHYYKGDNELGIGYFIGKDFLNYFEALFVAEDFDRNFSLQDMADGPDKLIYRLHPFKIRSTINQNWNRGHFYMNFTLTNKYDLRSTEPDTALYHPFYAEQAGKRDLNIRFWQDIERIRLGGIVEFKDSKYFETDTSRQRTHKKAEIIVEPMVAYRLSSKWKPHLYLTYNYKTEYDSLRYFASNYDSIFDYRRDVFAYMFDIEYKPGGRFVWHFGVQQAFYENNQDRRFRDRRLLLGLEYRFKNIWFYLVEAMEGDFPTPKYMHNHTYLHLMLRF